ncbi:MAG TPA: peptidyl-prolyl cis-trans isomerase [Sphingomicrobium sp.]|nr:peptidyl-prolyl cis-trans isomerase [Sphingomicrobium sp.]
MFAFIRGLGKSKVGTVVVVLFLLAIVASFALADVQGVLSGGMGGQSRNTLATVGSEEVTDREMSRLMERRLAQLRQDNPQAEYSAVAGDFEPMLEALIDEKVLQAFAAKHGFRLSKRLIDAEIANLPGVRGLGGQFSQQAYQQFLQQQRITDQEVRQFVAAGLLQRLLLTPAASSARLPVGVATPYANMLLEVREGEIAMIPAAAFTGGLNPSDEDLQRFYAANQARYTVPEQRVLRLARIGPEQVANITATEQEIAAYYQANQAQFAARETRNISQAVVPDRAAAEQIAQRARGGASLAAAAAPAGLSAEDVALGEQTRQQLAGTASEQVAAAAFGAASGAVVGPVRSDFGWHVLKVESVNRIPGRSLAQARGEIAQRLTADKRQNAIAEMVSKVEEEIAGGANYQEAAASAGLQITETPLITSDGRSRENSAYRFPEELAPALRSGFELEPNDEPVVETLPNNAGYVLVGPARVVPAAPQPLAQIRDRVREDWISQQALARARAAATDIAAKIGRNVAFAQAIREAGASLPPVQQVRQRRLELSQFGGQVPPPLQMLFTLGEGRSRMVADPGGRGFFIVKANRIIPGNAISQPSLIAQVQNEFQQAASQEYAQQFLASARAALGVRRNEQAIADSKRRLTGG